MKSIKALIIGLVLVTAGVVYAAGSTQIATQACDINSAEASCCAPGSDCCTGGSCCATNIAQK